MARTSTVAPPAVHAKTGLPVQEAAVFTVGDLVTEAIGSDGYPGVVVAVTANAVWVHRVSFVLGNVTDKSHVNYLDDTTLVVDPESVERALAMGKEGAHKYVLRVFATPRQAYSINEREQVGPMLHSARWTIPNANYGSVSHGARYRQDPHF